MCLLYVCAGPSNTDYGMVLLGILIMQDVFLGLLMAVLPNMARTPGAQGHSQVVDMVVLAVNLVAGSVLRLLKSLYISSCSLACLTLLVSEAHHTTGILHPWMHPFIHPSPCLSIHTSVHIQH